MKTTVHKPEYITQFIATLDKQIAAHEQILTYLHGVRKMWSEYEAPQMQIINIGAPLTRDLVRKFIKGYNHPVQTTQIIDILYSDKNVEDKYNLTKHLAVMLSQMAKDGELLSERKPGVKGNFYTLKDK